MGLTIAIASHLARPLALGAALLTSAPLAAQPTAPAPVGAQLLRDVVPVGGSTAQMVLTPDGARSYFVNTAGEVWLNDRATGTRTRVASGGASELSLSPTRTGLAFTRMTGPRGDTRVWAVALDTATGRAIGAAYPLSTRDGDTPSIAPDGRSVAFARDDSTGVGQHLIIVPFTGGAERVVTTSFPSSIGNIQWAPDGAQLYVGLNPPVACVPEWSCLPLARDKRRPPGSIRRVAVHGGGVRELAVARSVLPGLSPDGRLLVYLDTASTRRWIITDANGQSRDTLVLPSGQLVVGWLRGSTMILSAPGDPRGVRLHTLTVSTPGRE